MNKKKKKKDWIIEIRDNEENLIFEVTLSGLTLMQALHNSLKYYKKNCILYVLSQKETKVYAKVMFG